MIAGYTLEIVNVNLSVFLLLFIISVTHSTCGVLCTVVGFSHLSDETVKAVGPFYLVPMPGEVKYPTQGVNV